METGDWRRPSEIKTMQRLTKTASIVRGNLHGYGFLSHYRGLCSIPDSALAEDLDNQVSFQITLFFIFSSYTSIFSFLSLSLYRYWWKGKLVPELQFSTDLQFSMLSILPWCVFLLFKIMISISFLAFWLEPISLSFSS